MKPITSMRYINNVLFFLTLLVIAGCVEKGQREVKVAAQHQSKEDLADIIPGAERISTYYNLISNKNVACVANHTSMVGSKHLIDTLLDHQISIQKVFAPEHGFRGDVPDGQTIEDGVDASTGVSIVSLYGAKKKPDPEDMEGIDVVLFDIQDVGARFYTYLSTLHYVMEACAEQGILLIVLDRPNPNIHYIDGPVLEPEFKTFVGLHPVPIVYGMTIGEYALMVNGEGWLGNGLKCNLEIIPVKNYQRNSFYELPVAPSPNLPNQRAILLYPSLCFFEGTHVSIGRGTDYQFQVIGHPELTEFDYSFTPLPNQGSKYPKNNGKVCFGEDLTNLTIGGLMSEKRIQLSWLLKYYGLIAKKGLPFFIESSHFDRIAGTGELKQQLTKNYTEQDIRASWKEGLDAFKEIRSRYLIYD